MNQESAEEKVNAMVRDIEQSSATRLLRMLSMVDHMQGMIQESLRRNIIQTITLRLCVKVMDDTWVNSLEE